ncbi:xanthine dehydrogenase FAD-binding subunit XdhB [Edwardsiella hoshinae]|uniref:Carbon monoxide dehydrogenase medium chain n=1 Tax=Edwardsiella hoshinae TaxID=93378 RepID=A0A376DKN3_9GAMM|nr:xanthine dehydrogenase FAD-binding subunit XdhB [Edwardsiella hoshinae]AOV97868.1 xanthine dehydrogenase FAD-binding subunit XdhB [Edwardsiella hoshinae]QPR29248.1 xanthine dehydrogenase FAD-binding subunit XdhB [Edwardsiella hoshinae]STC90957.1 Carbon monoxide dehydrogenase medium chain [Edwardsiella hoshinae]
MYDIQRYLRATSARHASELMLAYPDSRLLAGGTDVLIQLHHHNAHYAHIVDIHGLAELCGIRELEDGTLRIGSGTTFSQLIEHPLIQARLPMLAEAAATIAGPQIRNVATYGGNICNGATSADSAAPSVALKAQLEILTPNGVILRPIDGFHTGPGKVALTPGEILLAFHFHPADHRDCGSAYIKYAMRGAMDIATIGCAALCRIADGRFSELRLAYGVAAPTPIRCPQAESCAIDQPLSRQTLAAVSEAVARDVSPRSSWRAEKEFRLHLIRTLAQRAITLAVQRAGGEIA